MLYPHTLNLLAQRDVSIGDLLHELRVRFVQHDVEVLHGMNRFQRLPILKPDDLDINPHKLLRLCTKDKLGRRGMRRKRSREPHIILADFLGKLLADEVIDLLPGVVC